MSIRVPNPLHPLLGLAALILLALLLLQMLALLALMILGTFIKIASLWSRAMWTKLTGRIVPRTRPTRPGPS